MKALPKPWSTAERTVLPSRSSSRIRSKIRTLAVHRHPDRQDQAGDARQRQRGPDRGWSPENRNGSAPSVPKTSTTFSASATTALIPDIGSRPP